MGRILTFPLDQIMGVMTGGAVELWGVIRSDEDDRQLGAVVGTQVVAADEAVHLR
jgi:hypothetical protein